MRRNRIKSLVEAILDQNDLHGTPVDVQYLTHLIGAEIRWIDSTQSLSGFALQKNGTKYIGINKRESLQRQRFTIAHELGHLFLHKQHSVSYDQDVMMMRDSHSSEGTDFIEIEANCFAAELLMPEKKIRQDLARIGGFDLLSSSGSTEKVIEKLAKKYDVSRQAMSVRLTTLYFT